jgi:hypothetical protein
VGESVSCRAVEITEHRFLRQGTVNFDIDVSSFENINWSNELVRCRLLIGLELVDCYGEAVCFCLGQKGFQADVVFIFTFAILGFFLGFAAELDIPAIGENLGGTSCHVSIKVPGAAVVAGRSQVYQLAILGPRHATEMLHAGATGIKFHRQIGDKRLWSDIDGSFQLPLPRVVTR